MRNGRANYAYEPTGEPRSNTTPETHRMPIYDMRPIHPSSTRPRGLRASSRPHRGPGFLGRRRGSPGLLPGGRALHRRGDRRRPRLHLRPHCGAGASTAPQRLFAQRPAPARDARSCRPHRALRTAAGARPAPTRPRNCCKGRVQVINLWRPIRGPLRDAPLAVCDARTVEPGDLVPSDLVYPNRVGETYAVTYNPAHRWYYVPEMRPDEALLLKILDSRTDGRARFAPHTAFTDPTTPRRRLPARKHRIAHAGLPPGVSRVRVISQMIGTRLRPSDGPSRQAVRGGRSLAIDRRAHAGKCSFPRFDFEQPPDDCERLGGIERLCERGGSARSVRTRGEDRHPNASIGIAAASWRSSLIISIPSMSGITISVMTSSGAPDEIP